MENDKQFNIKLTSDKKISKAGYEFYLDADFWRLDKDTVVSLKTIKNSLKISYVDGFLKTLSFYAENFSASYTNNLAQKIRYMLVKMHTSEINSEMLIDYRSTLTKNTEWYLGTIRSFIKKWHELGYDGVSDEVIDLIDNWTLKGAIKGDVVKRLDPQKGPLTDIELLAFNEGAVQAFEKSQINISELALALISSNTGRRQIQISHLKIKDVLKGKNRKGEDMYLLNIPRAKQRGATFRSQFKQFAITKELWTILNLHIQAVIKKIELLLNFNLEDSDRFELPLFPNFYQFQSEMTISELRQKLALDILHIKSQKIKEIIQKIVSVANIYSERTGKKMDIVPYRFRYTMGTRAAREGFGIMVIAELLDHSDTQNASVYIENIPEYAERINKKVGHLLAPYAQAFAGVLVNSEKDAERGNDLNSRIRSGGEGIGTCGSFGFCGARVPIPCYTCIHFQAWVDGPHRRVLDELIAERDRIKKITGDIAVAAINDRTILAVMEVIKLCEARRKVLN